jgi:hypothetical protein
LPEDESMDEEKAKEIAIRICDEFEDLLDEKNIMIPSADRKGLRREACLYGSEHYALEDGVVDILMEELAVGAKREDAAKICVEARTAVKAMQKAMAKAPEGLATVGAAKMREWKAPSRPVPKSGTTAPVR